jgi:sugar lactone lactonase YvrE
MSYRSRKWRMLDFASALVLSAMAAVPALAQSVPDTLWLGTDNRTDLNVVNVTKTGAVVRSFGPREATGLAILGSNIWASTSVTQAIDSFDLNALAGSGTITQSPGVLFGEDMASDGTFLYRSDVSGNRVYKVNPTTGAATVFISGVSGPLGVAYTGAFFYVSEFNTGLVRQFTLAGAPTGISFTVAAPGPVGGLAWDSCTNTLWLASGPTGSNRIYNINPTTGTILSSFASPNGRFADGLEYEGGSCSTATTSTQPVPTLSEWALILLGGLVALTGVSLVSRRLAR